MSRPKSPLQVIAEHLAAASNTSVPAALPEAEVLMDKLAKCRLPQDQSFFKLNDPASVALRVTAASNYMERMGLDPLFVHDVRRLASSVQAMQAEGHGALIQATLAYAESQAFCEKNDPPEPVWCRNDELRQAHDQVVDTYVDAARKELEK